MSKKAKKNVRISKLPRGQLITLCKGRGIALGQAAKRIAKLVVSEQSWRKAAVHNKAVSLRSKEETKRLRAISNEYEDTCVQYHTQLNTATDTIADQDSKIEDLATQITSYRDIVSDYEDKIEKLSSDVADFKELWHNASAKEKKHDDHWRRLTDWAYQSIGYLSRTLDMIQDQLTKISNEYKEE